MLILLISPSENSYKDKKKDIFDTEKGNAREKESPKSLNKQITLTFNPRIFLLEKIHPEQVVTTIRI